MYYIYFAKSLKNEKVYVGLTSILPKDRIAQHNSGSSKWSKNNLPLELLYYESYHCKKDADAREKFYKSGFGRQFKKCIIESVEGYNKSTLSSVG